MKKTKPTKVENVVFRCHIFYVSMGNSYPHSLPSLSGFIGNSYDYSVVTLLMHFNANGKLFNI